MIWLVIGLLTFVPASILSSQQQGRSNQDPARTAKAQEEQQQRGQQEEMLRSRDRDGDTPSLGVLVKPSPGQGVYVAACVWGSPAHGAGIQFGDYIMQVNGTDVSSPEELKQAIEQLEADATADLTIWRDGESLTKQVKLAEKAEQVPDSHRTWLGVVLTPTRSEEVEGVQVSRVFPDSPAERSGLQAGDVITEANGKSTTDIQSLLHCMESHGPGSACQLTVNRNGETKSIPITLEDVSSAPDEWMIVAFGQPLDLSDFDRARMPMQQGGGDLNQMVQQLRQEIMDLRNRVEKLESRNRTETQFRSDRSSSDDGDKDQASSGTNLPSSSIVAAASLLQPTAAITQDDDGRRRGRQRYGYDRYYTPYSYYPYYSSPSYYNYYPYGGYPNYTGGYYPYNWNWYYSYGGRNWYNNWDNYSPRYGVRVGPNWGFYWY